MAYIGVDIGTAGCKVTIMEKDGRIAAQTYREYDLHFPQPGYEEIDPDEVWGATRLALRDAAARYGGDIDAVATASFGAAAVLLDEQDRSLCRSIFYSDIRGLENMVALRERVDIDAMALRSGMPINHMYTLPKLLWVKEFQPQTFAKARKILPYSAFIAYKLSGEAAIDASQAARTLLFDRYTMNWDANTLDTFGIRREYLPRVVPAGKPIARMLDSVAAELGIHGRPLIVSGVHDQVGAALSAGAREMGDVVDGVGSAECISAVVTDEIDTKGLLKNNVCTEPYAIAGRSLAIAFNNTAGSALKWYRSTFEQELQEACRQDGRSAYQVLNSRMTDQPSPLLFLPYLAGTGTPYMDPQAKGMLYGLTLASTKIDIYRAILEGNCYEMRLNLELLANVGVRFDSVTAVGGGAVPEALRIKADILQMPVHTLAVNQGGTIGMAMLCGCATGQFADYGEAISALVKRAETIEPQTRWKDQYEEKYAGYKQMYQAALSIANHSHVGA